MSRNSPLADNLISSIIKGDVEQFKSHIGPKPVKEAIELVSQKSVAEEILKSKETVKFLNVVVTLPGVKKKYIKQAFTTNGNELAREYFWNSDRSDITALLTTQQLINIAIADGDLKTFHNVFENLNEPDRITAILGASGNLHATLDDLQMNPGEGYQRIFDNIMNSIGERAVEAYNEHVITSSNPNLKTKSQREEQDHKALKIERQNSGLYPLKPLPRLKLDPIIFQKVPESHEEQPQAAAYNPEEKSPEKNAELDDDLQSLKQIEAQAAEQRDILSRKIKNPKALQLDRKRGGKDEVGCCVTQ